MLVFLLLITIYLPVLGVGLGYCIMEHMIADRWMQIEDAVNSADPKVNWAHLREEQRVEGVRCPSGMQSNYTIPCPCSVDSITHGTIPHQGPSLIVVPPSLIVSSESSINKGLTDVFRVYGKTSSRR